jgi:hypothetical protein
MHKEKHLTKLLAQGFTLAAIIGPTSILAHEIGGHWIPAKILGAEQMSIGYTQVDIGTAKSWSLPRQVPIHGAGPVLTNILILVGLRLLKSKSDFLKLAGWGMVLTSYRAISVLIRQISGEDDIQEKILNTDETMVGLGLNISKFVVSIPEFILSIWFLYVGYKFLPRSNKKAVAATAFLGTITGTFIYIEFLGPMLWNKQKNGPFAKMS